MNRFDSQDTPMTSSAFPDPFQIWREALSRLESDVNTLATGSLQSQEVLQSLHQFSTVSLNLQQVFEKTLEECLRRTQLPSRKQVSDLAVSLRRIEDKLDGLLPPDASAGPAPRPARTRRPPGTTPPAAPAGGHAPAVTKARDTRRGPRADKG